MVIEQNLNRVKLKLINHFKDTTQLRIMIINIGGCELVGDPSKVQQFMAIIIHRIEEVCNSNVFIGNVVICGSNGWN